MPAEFKFKFIEWDGKPISKPGIYSKIPIEVYHTQDVCVGPSVSSSNLRTCFLESPAHFYANWSGNPNRKEEEDKHHFVFGRALHHLMLGEPFFAKLFAVRPDEYPSEDRKTGEVTFKKWTRQAAYCAQWEMKQERAGRAILTSTDLENLKGCAKRLGMNAIVKAGALNGYIERSMIWRDKDTGLWLKSRPDSIPGDSGDYVDLKTTQSVQWKDLQRTIHERGYFMQKALVRMGARALGLPFTSATLMFVEKSDPWCERVVTLKEPTLDRGERANRAAIDTIAANLKRNTGYWPGPGGEKDDATPIELPEWADKSVDDRIKFGAIE